jgi:hypothetical protein
MEVILWDSAVFQGENLKEYRRLLYSFTFQGLSLIVLLIPLTAPFALPYLPIFLFRRRLDFHSLDGSYFISSAARHFKLQSRSGSILYLDNHLAHIIAAKQTQQSGG